MVFHKQRRATRLSPITILTQLADDTTCFVKDKISIESLITIFKDFEICSGLETNLDKTKEKVIVPESKVKVLNISFIKRRLDNSPCKWKNMAKHLYNTCDLELYFKYNRHENLGI